MTKYNRIKLKPAQELALTTQVDSVCPLCSKKLFYSKNGRSFKDFDFAHIYPLNPTSEEIELLQNEKKMNQDINHEDNLIPLCTSCHNRYDKPRTIEEYRYLYHIKEELLKSSKQKELWSEYQIEDDINKIIHKLCMEEFFESDIELSFESKDITKKIDKTIPMITKNKISNYITNYFQYIKNQFILLEEENPTVSTLISCQIKAYYYKQKKLGLKKLDIFINIVEWLYKKTNPRVKESVEILTSFFIQNCEVFE